MTSFLVKIPDEKLQNKLGAHTSRSLGIGINNLMARLANKSHKFFSKTKPSSIMDIIGILLPLTSENPGTLVISQARDSTQFVRVWDVIRGSNISVAIIDTSFFESINDKGSNTVTKAENISPQLEHIFLWYSQLESMHQLEKINALQENRVISIFGTEETGPAIELHSVIADSETQSPMTVIGYPMSTFDCCLLNNTLDEQPMLESTTDKIGEMILEGKQVYKFRAVYHIL